MNMPGLRSLGQAILGEIRVVSKHALNTLPLSDRLRSAQSFASSRDEAIWFD